MSSYLFIRFEKFFRNKKIIYYIYKFNSLLKTVSLVYCLCK